MKRKMICNKMSILLLATIIPILYCIIFWAALDNADAMKNVDWNKLQKESQNILQKNNSDIMANFHYIISLSNTGMIEEAYNHIDYIKENISLEELNILLAPHIAKLDNDPDNILLHNYAAFSGTLNSEYEKSIPYFKRLVELEPDNIWIRNFLAATYLELKEYEQAKKEINKTLEIKNNNYSHLILALIYYEKGDYINALIELGRSGDLGKKIIFN